MPYTRVFGSSLTTGTPFIAITAEQDNPTTRTVLGGPDNTAMVEHRWEMYLEDGMPADDDYATAIRDTQNILDTGQHLPGTPVIP